MLRILSLALVLVMSFALAVPALAQDEPQLLEESLMPEGFSPSGWLEPRYIKTIFRGPGGGLGLAFTNGTTAIITPQYGAFDLIGPLTTCMVNGIPVKLWDNNAGTITMVQMTKP